MEIKLNSLGMTVTALPHNNGGLIQGNRGGRKSPYKADHIAWMLRPVSLSESDKPKMQVSESHFLNSWWCW